MLAQTLAMLHYMGDACHVLSYVRVEEPWVVLGEDLSWSVLTSEVLADSWINPDRSLVTGFECNRATLAVILLVFIPCFKWLRGARCVAACLCEPVEEKSFTFHGGFPHCSHVCHILQKRLFRLAIHKFLDCPCFKSS